MKARAGAEVGAVKGLQVAGLVLGAAVSGLLILFMSGEILTDPGGVTGLLAVLAWLAVPAVLTILAILRPAAAYPILVATVGLVLLAAAVSIPLARQVWEFEDTHGPINLMILLGALVPLVALGRAMPARAGWLMIITIVGSLALQGISLLIAGQASVIVVFFVLTPPFLISAALLIASARQAEPATTPDGSTPQGLH